MCKNGDSEDEILRGVRLNFLSAMEHRAVKPRKRVDVCQLQKWNEQSRNRRNWITWESLNHELGGSFLRKQKSGKTGRLDE